MKTAGIALANILLIVGIVAQVALSKQALENDIALERERKDSSSYRTPMLRKGQYDLANLIWGMTKEQVLESLKDSNAALTMCGEVVYFTTSVNDNVAEVYCTFTEGKLTEVNYHIGECKSYSQVSTYLKDKHGEPTSVAADNLEWKPLLGYGGIRH